MSATAKSGSLSEHQFAFTSYIRDPHQSVVPDDIEKRRIDLYRELMFNNVESFVSTSFPVLRRLMDQDAWNNLVQDFFARHRCKTPYFSGISEEFLEYLQNERKERKSDLPFMLELAHYEWVEMALALSPDELPVENRDSIVTENLHQKVILSALAWPLVYRYPVHRISTSFQPQEPPAEPTYLVVYRNFDDEVKFLAINTITYHLLLLFENNQEKTAESCLKQLSEENPLVDKNAIFDNGINIIQGFCKRGIALLVE